MSGQSVYTYVLNDPINFFDPFGLAQFGVRPIDPLPGPVWLYENLFDDPFNTDLTHEQLFFGDGKDPSDLGSFPNGVHPDDPNNKDKYKMFGPHYDDDLMREAVKNVPGGKWCAIGNNCHDWADKIRKEYDRLKREKNQCRL